MMESKISILKKSLVLAVFIFVMATLGVFLTSTIDSSAKAIAPSGKKDTTDAKNILNELNRSGKVKLKKGKKYYLKSPLKLGKGDWSIDATGAKIISYGSIIQKSTSSMKKTNYADVKNITVKGGTWTYYKSKGFVGSSFRFAHGNNLKFLNMTVKHTNYDGHCFEFIACKNITMSNCKIIPQGTKEKSQECMVQIDVASKTTAGSLPARLLNGATCKNVTIKNCTITGNAGVASSWSKNEPEFFSCAHSNIKIIGNKLTGVNYEGLSLRNCSSVTITGNTIVSKLGTNSSSSSGLSCTLPGDIKEATAIISNNTIKGGMYAVTVSSANGTSLYSKISLTDNRLYCKNSVSGAVHCYNISVFENSRNEIYKW